MKRFVLIAVLAFLTIFAGCDKQKALDNIMADQQMRSYLMQQMLSDEATRAEMADSILNDQAITEAYITGLVENEISRADLLNRMVAADSAGEWITSKLAENPDMKAAMRKASRK